MSLYIITHLESKVGLLEKAFHWISVGDIIVTCVLLLAGLAVKFIQLELNRRT